jgi:hypothetical protein
MHNALLTELFFSTPAPLDILILRVFSHAY